MALYNGSAFGNISGELLGVVASKNKSGSFLKNKGKITDAKTQKQLARRAIYGEFCTLWDSFYFRRFNEVPQKMRKEYFSFKNVLAGCLSLNDSAVNMLIVPKWKNATLSAPVLHQFGTPATRPFGVSIQTQIYYPAALLDSNFVAYGAMIGVDPAASSESEVGISFTNHDTITSNLMIRWDAIGYKDLNPTAEMISCKVIFYGNVKTGQISKPLVLFIKKDLSIEVFYPFGK